MLLVVSLLFVFLALGVLLFIEQRLADGAAEALQGAPTVAPDWAQYETPAYMRRRGLM